MFNQLAYNPGFAGSREAICASILYRNQWGGFTGPSGEGAPVTQLLSLHSPLNIKGRDRLGVGVNIINDVSEGFISTMNVMGSLAYRMDLPFSGAKLGIGANFGFSQKSLDAKWRAPDMSDPRLPGNSSQTIFDAGAGMYMYNPDWYFGLSALHLPGGKIDWAGTSAYDYKLATAYYVVGGYNMPLSGNIALQPTFLYKRDNAKGILDLSAQAVFNQKFYGGLNFRTGRLYATSVFGGIYLGNMQFGFAYDVPTAESSVFGSTFEVFARYCFRISIPPPLDIEIDDVRWL